MARSPMRIAQILSALYELEFGGSEDERYRIEWAQLRGIAGVNRLNKKFLSKIATWLNENGNQLIICDDFLIICCELDFDQDRRLPPRLVEEYIYDQDDMSEDDAFEDDEDLS